MTANGSIHLFETHLEDVDVGLEHDNPHARRLKLCLAIVEV